MKRETAARQELVDLTEPENPEAPRKRQCLLGRFFGGACVPVDRGLASLAHLRASRSLGVAHMTPKEYDDYLKKKKLRERTEKLQAEGLRFSSTLCTQQSCDNRVGEIAHEGRKRDKFPNMISILGRTWFAQLCFSSQSDCWIEPHRLA